MKYSLVTEFPDFLFRLVFLDIIEAVMSNGLGVLSKLMVDASPDRQSDRDGGMQFVNDLLPEVIHRCAAPGGMDVVTAGVLNAV